VSLWLTCLLDEQAITTSVSEIDESTSLMTSQSLSMFATAYYRLLMECNRRCPPPPQSPPNLQT
jgi:hypothetical protein